MSDGPSSSDDEIIGRSRPRPQPIDTNPPAKKTGAQLLAELRAKRAAGLATPGRSGTPMGSPGGSALLERLRASRAAQSPTAGGQSGEPPQKITAASIAMSNAQNIWNDTMSTLRLNQRKHAVHKQAERRPTPELHIIGEIVAASGFGPHGVSCRYEFVTVYVVDLVVSRRVLAARKCS